MKITKEHIADYTEYELNELRDIIAQILGDRQREEAIAWLRENFEANPDIVNVRVILYRNDEDSENQEWHDEDGGDAWVELFLSMATIQDFPGEEIEFNYAPGFKSLEDENQGFDDTDF